MASAQIESDVPLPRPRPVSEALARCRMLEVGQSFALLAKSKAARGTMQATACNYGKQSGKKFRTGQCPKDPAKYRVWRVQ